MWHLVLAHRHLVGPINQDVGAHQQRIAEKSIGGQILVRQLFLLILVGRYPFQPAQWRHHRHQQMQFGMFGHARLDEQRRLRRIDPGSEPVDNHVPGILGDTLRLIVGGRQRMPVGDKEQARVFVLQLDPVGQHAMVVTKVKAASRPHPRENSFGVHIWR